MLHTKGDNEFQEAAKHYPLNTLGADWDAVKKKLAARQKDRRKLFWFIPSLLIALLLLILPFKLFFNERENRNTPTANKVSVKTQLQNPIRVSANNYQTPGEKMQPAFEALVKYGAGASATRPLLVQVKKDVFNKREAWLPKVPMQLVFSNSAAEPGNSLLNAGGILKNDLAGNIHANIEVASTFEDAVGKKVEKAFTLNRDTVLSATKSSNVQDLPVNPASKKASSGKLSRNKKFYAGFVLGPDLSSIKLQSVKKVGYSLGLLTGFAIRNKWAIETGLLLDKKYYHTTGKYFNTRKLAMPYTIKIDEATGNCKMYELPINIKYNLGSHKKTNVFLVAGTSSYFMKKEYYTYQYDYNGNTYRKGYTYQTRQSSFFSVINFGAGVNWAMGRNIQLQMQPYIKLPVKKIGTGSLPIQSAGALVSITKNLF
ncbi:MAG: hypothetical protein ABIO05_02455 [Ferruginibacter sp.]